MSVCGHCGLAVEEGAAACGKCGFIVAPPRSASAGSKWGTLDIQRAPRPAAAPVPAAAPAAVPLMAAEPADDPEPSADSGPALELDAPAPRGRAAKRPDSASLGAQAEPRTGTRPIGRDRAQGASRPLSRPLGADAGQPARGASRPLSGPLAVEAGQQPAGAANRGRPGREGQPARAPGLGGAHDAAHARAGTGARAQAAPMARPNARSQSGTMPIPQPTAAGHHLETGMLDMDDGFSAALQQGPALEVASLQPQRPERPEPRVAEVEAPREDPAEQRQRRVRDLARYAQPPAKLLGTMAYFVRVYSRRRELQTQIFQLTQQRKRLELASEDALST